jgi:ATP-dependent protease Clp ATPase subunit
MSSSDETGRIQRLDRETLEARVRQAAQRLLPDRVMDDLEVRHLARVITECSLLLADVYSEDRLARIMRPAPELIAGLIDQFARRRATESDRLLQRVRSLPDEVRMVGDKALFDMGMLGRREVKGYDLAALGAQAYRSASEALELLAEDRQLQEYFKENRLLMLPLEEEVVFLRQCSDQIQVHADILRQLGELRRRGGGSLEDVAARVPLMAAAAAALGQQEEPSGSDPPIILSSPEPDDGRNVYLERLRADATEELSLSREQLLSLYERMLLFASLDPQKLREALDATVIDQRQAVAALCDEFSLFAAGTRDPRKPPAYFLVGPTGVGKNHLVETLCRLLEGVWQIDVPTLTIEGPNYTYPSDINELRGATRGFIRSDEEGLLTAFHKKSSRAPLAVILIDEVDKAHPQLLTFFLSILDRGTTTDNRGQVLNFANCMVFFTSNVGYSDAQQRSAPIGYLDEEERQGKADRDTRSEIRRALKPEFVNRVRLIHFSRLTRSSVDRILDLEMARIAARYREMHGLEVVLDQSARAELIRRGYSAAYGARRLATTLESVCNVELARKVRRDDQAQHPRRDALVDWLREIRAGKRAFSAEEVKQHVVEQARAQLGYHTIRVTYDGEQFHYSTEDGA